MDLGFEQAGFEIIWSNEFDLAFARMNKEGNKNNKIINTRSILELENKDILSEAFPKGKPKIFGIIGGPPCQDFSAQGKKLGFNGERGKLTITYINKILDLKPSFFVMENVPGLIRNKETKDYFMQQLKRMEKFYYIKFKKLNALDFGVPQSRERIFIVGLRKHLFHDKFSFPEEKHIKNEYEWENSNNAPIELCVESHLVPRDKIHEIPNANETFNMKVTQNFLENIKEGELNRSSFKRLHRYRYAPTICYGNNEVFLHPYENRRLSVRESLRLQGVPDEYVVSAEIPITKKFKMISNAVPPPLAKAVAESIKISIQHHGTKYLLNKL